MCKYLLWPHGTHLLISPLIHSSVFIMPRRLASGTALLLCGQPSGLTLTVLHSRPLLTSWQTGMIGHSASCPRLLLGFSPWEAPVDQRVEQIKIRIFVSGLLPTESLLTGGNFPSLPFTKASFYCTAFSQQWPFEVLLLQTRGWQCLLWVVRSGSSPFPWPTPRSLSISLY